MNDDKPADLHTRTKAFALRIINLYGALPKTVPAQVIGKQVLRSGTSVGAHYREGSRARSTAEFISKLSVGIQELEETLYWLDLLAESGIVKVSRLESLQQESNELLAMLIASVRTAKEKQR